MSLMNADIHHASSHSTYSSSKFSVFAYAIASPARLCVNGLVSLFLFMPMSNIIEVNGNTTHYESFCIAKDLTFGARDVVNLIVVR